MINLTGKLQVRLGSRFRSIWSYQNFVNNVDASYDGHSFLTMYSPLQIAESGDKPFTDYSRWRLLVNDGGRHTWHYLRSDEECMKRPQNYIDRFWLGLPVVRAR